MVLQLCLLVEFLTVGAGVVSELGPLLMILCQACVGDSYDTGLVIACLSLFPSFSWFVLSVSLFLSVCVSDCLSVSYSLSMWIENV